jgi:uncharacterized membrane protein
MVVRIAITLLCGVGLFTALFMLNKAQKAERGLLTEASVVQTPRAHLLGPNNALIGAAFYPILAILVWIAAIQGQPLFLDVAILAALAAAAMSAVLAYSLLRVTKMPCPFCWTAHVANWLLAILCVVLHFQP